MSLAERLGIRTSNLGKRGTPQIGITTQDIRTAMPYLSDWDQQWCISVLRGDNEELPQKVAERIGKALLKARDERLAED